MLRIQSRAEPPAVQPDTESGLIRAELTHLAMHIVHVFFRVVGFAIGRIVFVRLGNKHQSQPRPAGRLPPSFLDTSR